MKKNSGMIFGWVMAVGILLAACSPGEQAGLAFEDAWIRPLPPGMKMTAGFGSFRNPGNESIEIVAFTSPDFGDVSLHRTELTDGVSKMLEVPSLTIGAGQTAVLEPGGYHLMLMMPAVEVQSGHAVTISLDTADGRRFSFSVPVERR